MCKVSHYFCIFCDFTCEEYDKAFDHYKLHMFANGNCEVCNYNKLAEYVADTSNLSKQCYHDNCRTYKDIYTSHVPLNHKQNLMVEVIHYWIKRFLSYQKKILDITYEKLLLANKVCRECAVCCYLLGKYKSDGGDMNRIQYIRDNKVEHCYQHMRYDPNSQHINEYIANSEDHLRIKSIRKLEAFIENFCDTFFTGGEDNNDDNNDSVVNIGIIDDNSTIQDNDSECLSCSEATETISQLSPSFEDTLQQSLAPILAKLSVVESRIDSNDSEQKNTESKLEYFESELNTLKSERNEVIPPATVAYFASRNAPIGWLKADGQTLSRVKHAKLFVAIGIKFGCGDGINTFTLPDLRGEFIRGWSDDRGDVDRNRVFGSFQWGSSIPMSANLFNGGIGSISTKNLSFAGVSFDHRSENVTAGTTRDGIIYPNGSHKFYTDDGSSSKIASWNVLKGTRPRNIALLACIKY